MQVTHPVLLSSPLVHPGHWMNNHWLVPSFCCLNPLLSQRIQLLNCLYRERAACCDSQYALDYGNQRRVLLLSCVSVRLTPTAISSLSFSSFKMHKRQKGSWGHPPLCLSSVWSQVRRENTLWCNGVRGRDNHLFSRLQCVCACV